MTKTLFTIVTVAFLIVFTSVGSTKVVDSKVGHEAPQLELDCKAGKMSLQSHRGGYVLLTFWSSGDASSRVKNLQYDRLADKKEGVVHLSVNFDRTESLFEEICKMDNLTQGTQFYCNDEQRMRLMELWRQENGYSTFLINPEGVIVAVNPEMSELQQI